MSDCDNLIDTSMRNLFCLCFRNSAKLSLLEITETFSKYGNVVGINCSGPETGYYFVRYRSMEEAQRCLTNLKEHRQIKFQPVRSRYGNTNNGTNKDGVNKSTRNKFERSNSVKGSINGSWKMKNKNGGQNSPAVFSNADDNSQENSDNLTKAVESLQNAQSLRKIPVSTRLTRNFQSDNKTCHQSENGESPNPLNVAKFAELQKRRGVIAYTFKPQSDNHVTESYKTIIDTPAIPATFMPPSIKSGSHSSHNSSTRCLSINDIPPPLVVGQPEEKTHVIVTTDVVVANIHSNLGVADIYQILRNFNPIYIADIETIPEINMRFCYVYFKTQQDAFGVEQSLDGTDVCGQQLIALRSNRLAAEAAVF